MVVGDGGDAYARMKVIEKLVMAMMIAEV